MNAIFKIVAWWVACLLLAVFLSIGFALISLNLRWDQRAQETAQMNAVWARPEWR